jgi:hypothetical protein
MTKMTASLVVVVAVAPTQVDEGAIMVSCVHEEESHEGPAR